jgi:hypothetical protein
LNKVIGIFFLLACIATSAVSNSIMGAGIWFWVIIFIGCFVAISQFYPKLRGAGSGLALLLSIMSVCAILLGLLASTIGGSFRMDESSSLLLCLFFMIALYGFLLAILHKKYLKSCDDGV